MAKYKHNFRYGIICTPYSGSRYHYRLIERMAGTRKILKSHTVSPYYVNTPMRVIALCRDPYEVVASWLRRFAVGGLDSSEELKYLHETAEWWGAPWITETYRYEDWIGDELAHVRDMCRVLGFSGASAEEAVDFFSLANQEVDLGNNGSNALVTQMPGQKTELSDYVLKWCNRTFGRVIDRLGYSRR